MRNYIFTSRERKILEKYVDTGIKEKGFSVVMIRMRKNVSQLRKDIELIETLMSDSSLKSRKRSF